MSMQPFRPVKDSTKVINVSSSSQSVKIINSTGGTVQVRIYNEGTATAFLAHGDSTVTASLSTSQPFGPGTEVQTWGIPDTGDLYFAAIAVGATGKVYVTVGVGI